MTIKIPRQIQTRIPCNSHVILCISSESDEDCNSIFGCYNLHPEGLELCTCYRECPNETAAKVCGSDSIIYDSECHMEVQACNNDVYVELMPMEYCTSGIANDCE